MQSFRFIFRFSLLIIFFFIIKKFVPYKLERTILSFFFRNFLLIYIYLCRDWSLICKIIFNSITQTIYFNFYILDYNIFIKELYILYFLYLFTFYIPFIILFSIYVTVSIVFNYKGILFIIYFFVSVYFFSLVLAQNQLINEIVMFSLENSSFMKPFSTLNLTVLLFNFKGYFYDVFRIRGIAHLVVYVLFFCRQLSNEIYLIFKKDNNLYVIRWSMRIFFYFLYLYFLSSFIYKFFFYFFISRILCIEYSFFFMRFRWYLKGFVLLKIESNC